MPRSCYWPCIHAAMTLLLSDCRSVHRDDSLTEASLAQTEALPDASMAGTTAVKKWSAERLREAETIFAQSGQMRLASPVFWGGELVYQIMVDRFNDGDPSNNFRLVSDRQAQASQSRYQGIAEYHHGGDLKGVTNRLNYLSDLGITALWLTPILRNEGGAYHGYCTSDFTQLDPNYGTKEQLAELVKEAHKRNIRVILDIVVNHMCDEETRYARRHTRREHERCSQDLDRSNSEGSPTSSDDRIDLVFSTRFFPPFKTQHFFNRCGANTQQDMEGQGATSVYGDFTTDMLDFDTRNYDFQEIFANLMKYWIAYADIDGFRLDAVKHINPSFTAFFATTVRDYAKMLGKSDFYLVSEVAGDSATISKHLGRMSYAEADKSWRQRLESVINGSTGATLAAVASSHRTFPYPGSNGVFDFAHSGIARDVLLNKKGSRSLENYFGGDSYYRDISRQGDPRLNFTLLEIHDWPRFNQGLPNEPLKSSLGLSYLATAPGIPVIYYGMEQGFNGHCRESSISPDIDALAIQIACATTVDHERHPLYRQDMFQGGMLRLGSSLKKLDALAYIGPPKVATTAVADPYVDRDNQIFQAARRFNYLRRSCYALRFGDIAWRWTTDRPDGFLAFSRIDRGKEVLVLVNTSGASKVIPDLGVSQTGTIFVNSQNPKEVGRPTDSGRLNFAGASIAENSVQVFIPEGHVGRFSPYLKTHLCKDIEVTVPEEHL